MPRLTATPAYIPFLVAAGLLGCRRETQTPDQNGPPATAATATAPPLVTSADIPLAATEAPPKPTIPDFGPNSFGLRVVPEDGPRLYAKTRHVWIYAEPDATKQWIGYLWTGGSVRLRDRKPRYGIGCDVFYAIEPRGYVCVDRGRATLDPKDPVVVSTYPYAPRVGEPFLHRYGESRGAPLYLALPTESEQLAREGDLKAHRERVRHALATGNRPALLEGVELTPSPEGELTFPKLPVSIHEAHAELKARSTVAFSAELRFQGRDFLLTSDFRYIPKDRVKIYENRYFQGVKLDATQTLPMAWFRDAGRVRYQRRPDGTFSPTGETFPRHSHVSLSPETESRDGESYQRTQAGEWLRLRDATIARAAEKTPWDSDVGQPDNGPHRPKGRATWIEVSIYGGWLIAYEGTHPVFVTLVSPGHGGAPQPGRAPLETYATPIGRFAITSKVVSSTMVAPNDYIHSEVPYAQVFSGPYALHSAYWHDNWGHLMSGGCVNLSPIDAQYLFQWTEPEAPPGWYGTRWLPYLEPSTTLIIHR